MASARNASSDDALIPTQPALKVPLLVQVAQRAEGDAGGDAE